MAEVVPSELGRKEKFEFRNGDRAKMTEELQRRIRKSGLPDVQEVLPDPDDPERAYLILGQGQEPCSIEIEQMKEHGTNLEAVAEIHPGSRLGERLRMLRGAAGP